MKWHEHADSWFWLFITTLHPKEIIRDAAGIKPWPIVLQASVVSIMPWPIGPDQLVKKAPLELNIL